MTQEHFESWISKKGLEVETFLYAALKRPEEPEAKMARAELDKGSPDRTRRDTLRKYLNEIGHEANQAVELCRNHVLLRPETRWAWLKDPCWRVRQAALISYAIFDVTPEMIKAGLADSDAHVRMTAMDACHVSDESRLELVLTGLKDPDSFVRLSAQRAWLFSYCHDSKPIPLEIIQFWQQMPDREAHLDAMRYAYRQCGANRKVPLDVIQAGLKDPAPDVRAEAEYICKQRALPPAAILAGVENDPEYRSQLAYIQSRQETASSAEIQEWLNAFDWHIREAANVVFHQLG